MSEAVEAADPSTREPRSKLLTVIGLVLAFAWLLLLWIPGISTHQITSVHDDVIGIVVKWLVTLLLAVIAFAVQRYKPSDFGLGEFHWSDALLGLGGFVVALIVTGAVSSVVTMPNSLSQLQKIAALPLSLRIAVVCSAAFCEEFIFRGFAIEEFASFVRHRWLAGLLSLILFTLGHIGLYGFSAALLIPCIAGAILTGLYLWRHSLFGCIVMHLFLDGFLMVVVPSFVHAH